MRRKRRTLRAVLKDRRGATALILAASAVALFGLAALATEGGNWYYTQRNSRSASDMAAMAGANVLYWGTLSDPALTTPAAAVRGRAIDVAAATAGANGFRAGEQGTAVTINIPPLSGPNQANNFAVEAIVRRNVQTFASALFLGANSVDITTRAVATINDIGPVCVLSLRGTLTLTGSSTVNTPGCVLASNSRNNPSVEANLNGNPITKSVTAAGLYGVGNVYATGNINASVLPGQPALPDPFASRIPAVNPTCTGTTTTQNVNDLMKQALATQYGSLTGTNYICGSGGNGSNFKNTLTVGSTQSLDLRPGTYYLYNTNLVVQGTLTCTLCSGVGGGVNGVTLVFAGDQPGTIDVNSSATFQLNAPSSGAWEDMLIYRAPDTSAGNGNGNNAVPSSLINGNSTSYFTGGIYMPTGQVTFSGNSTNPFKCTVIVAHTVTFTGNSNTTSNCAEAGVPVQRIRVVRLVE